MSASRPAAVVVLAAGEGTRMRSSTPKVLHPLLGRPMLGHVLDAVAPLDPVTTLVVVGHGREQVTTWLSGDRPCAQAVVQERQDGTGHAVRVALEHAHDVVGTVVVVSGDTPLLRAATLQQALADHQASGAAATVLTARVFDPTGYGRIVRDAHGGLVAIVEHRDADDAQRAIDEINSGLYLFEAGALRAALGRLTRDNDQGEEYLTDVVARLREAGEAVAASVVPDAVEVQGVNDRVQLAEAGARLRDRVAEDWMRRGVTMVDPATTWVGVEVELAPDVTLLPGVTLSGRTSVARGATVGPDTTLEDCTVGEDAVVRSSTCRGAVVGARASVGPYSYLRPGTDLADDTKVGAFVETKAVTVGVGSKIPHLSYVGDAEIGEGSNIGAATVFVNYDGVAKHRTVVGDHVRVGSDTMLVAPVTVGDGAYTAAGSVITDDVPPGAMGVGRSRQRTIAGWVARRRAGSASAAAAERAAGGRAPATGDNEQASGATGDDGHHGGEGQGA